MEASFVNQLYDSSNLLGWPPRKWNPSESQPSSQKDCNTCISSGQVWTVCCVAFSILYISCFNFVSFLSVFAFQFKVLRGGSWQKMECVRAENKRHDDLQSDPWIRHFRSSRRGQDPGLPFLQENAASTSKAVKQKGKHAVSCGGDSTSRQFLLWNSLYHRDSVGSNIGSSRFSPLFLKYVILSPRVHCIYGVKSFEYGTSQSPLIKCCYSCHKSQDWFRYHW